MSYSSVTSILNQVHYQSINQSTFYSANIHSEARLGCATAELVFTTESKKQLRNINRASGVLELMGGNARSNRCILVKVPTEMAEWIDSGRLFQRDGAQEWKALVPELVSTPGTDRLIPSIDFSEQRSEQVKALPSNHNHVNMMNSVHVYLHV